MKTIDWNRTEDIARAKTTPILISAMREIESTIIHLENKVDKASALYEDSPYYYDELSVYRTELNRRLGR